MNNSINIYVAGKNIAGILESIASPPGISCRVFALETGTRITPHAVNVFILRRLPGKIISGAKYILCSKSHDSLTSETLGTLYDLWPEPLTPSLLRFHYAKLLERIALEQLTTSEETEHQKRILEMARQDYLTGLATRWYLQEYIRRNQDEQNVTCIYLDLDNFKKVNDTYGHQAGDRALAATAEMMQQKFSDGFCARMGGDEFMIVLLGMREISDVAEKVSTFMAGLMEYYAGTKTMRALSVSAGISQKTHGDGKSIDQLIHESDMALYEAKKSGRACCKVYNPSLEERNNDESDTEGRKYYLVDFENVHSAGLDGIHKLDADSTVCIFYSRNASNVTSGLNFGMMESKAEIKYQHAEAGNKNALDFQLSSYLGVIITENAGKNCKYYIVSRDSGYSSLIPFWKDKGITVEIISDISGRGLFAQNSLAHKVSILTGEMQLAPQIAGIIRHCKTKMEVNHALQKLCRGTMKTSHIYRAIRPLIDDKPGDSAKPRETQPAEITTKEAGQESQSQE